MTIILTGQNSFLMSQQLSKIVDDFVKQYGDMAVEKIDAEEADLQKIIEAIQALPFLAAKRLVVLRNPSVQKAFTEQFEELLKTVPESTELIIVETKLDKRSSYYKTLKKLAGFKEYEALDPSALARWLQAYAKEQGGTIDFSAANYLVGRLGVNQQMLANELQKLINYNPTITRETIEVLTEQTPQSNIFNLLDAALNGQNKQAMKIYEELRRQKVEPFNILGMISWQLHVLALLKTAGERSIDEITKEAGVSPFVLRKSTGVAARLTLKQLKELVRRAFELDGRLKSESIDADEALQNYLLKLAPQ